MPESVPVASNLLDSKFLGFSVRRVAEALAIPVAPCAVCYTIGLPLVVTLPLFVAGIGIGGTVYVKTPTAQRPLRYTAAVVRHLTGPNVYTLDVGAPIDDTDDVGADEWLTRDAPPHASRFDEATAAVETQLLASSAPAESEEATGHSGGDGEPGWSGVR